MFVRNRIRGRGEFVAVASLMLIALVLNRAIADSPVDAKRVALEVVERNADQMATVGDVLYYFGEPAVFK